MKKKFELVKTIQLIILCGITGFALFRILTQDTLYQTIGRDPQMREISILLWLTLGLSFFFVLWDFSSHSSFKKDYRELDYAVHNDHIAGIANRYSCDSMIEKYMDKPLPDTIGCIMLDLNNIREINEAVGHARGNEMIQLFSSMLQTASLGVCFVGRNGGNKFMALFEDCSEQKLNTFLNRVRQQVETHNRKQDMPHIEYRTGRAFSKDEKGASITQLISLSDRRLAMQTDNITGFANRSSCDDIIALYLDKPLPECLGCIMLDIANIREINEAKGHLEGNQAIRRFGDILRIASAKRCFVGRNGGTKFLALFEECTQEKMDAFLGDVARLIEEENQKADVAAIRYRYGKAFQEGPEIGNIIQLVALSDRRSRQEG